MAPRTRHRRTNGAPCTCFSPLSHRLWNPSGRLDVRAGAAWFAGASINDKRPTTEDAACHAQNQAPPTTSHLRQPLHNPEAQEVFTWPRRRYFASRRGRADLVTRTVCRPPLAPTALPQDALQNWLSALPKKSLLINSARQETLPDEMLREIINSWSAYDEEAMHYFDRIR